MRQAASCEYLSRNAAPTGLFENSFVRAGADCHQQMSTAIFLRVKRPVIGVALLLGWASSSPAQYTNGIYAEFNTSMGSFTCRVEYAIVPKAVANFIGLATGQRPCLDLPSGTLKTNPFYNGTTFHRVIAGFMNQGGSPSGQGTDGPGYEFVDEFSPSLRHDRFGVLSMANSGPDSNGSQYFITVAPTPWLNDVHTVFGSLYGGSNVVYAINHVATNANGKPLTDVAVNGISIRRIGTAAAAFDIYAQGLPLVTNLKLNIAKAATNVSLTFSNRLNADNRLYASTNLTSWLETLLGIEVASPVSNILDRGITAPKEFFRVAQVQYPPTLLVPKTVMGRTLTLNFSGGSPIIVVSFDNSGGGTYTWDQGLPGVVEGYNWIQDPYRGRFWPIYFSGIIPMVLHLDYDTATAGTFKGTAYPSEADPFAVSGNVTSTP